MTEFRNDSLLNPDFNVSDDSNRRGSNDYLKITYAIPAVLGIVGNFLVICIIAKSTILLKMYTNILIMNQSIVDLLASLLILVTKVLMEPRRDLTGIAGELYCRLWGSHFLLWSLLISSSYSLMALTFERYVSIVHPILHREKVSTSKVIQLAGVAWCPGFLVTLIYTVSVYRVRDGRCIFGSNVFSDSGRKAYGVAMFVIQYLIPAVCFITCYSRIFICLRNRVVDESQASNNTAAVQKARARRNVLKTFVIVVVCYMACTSCNQFLMLASNFGVSVDFRGVFYHFTVVATFTNCCINPFIYALKFERYQNEFSKLFCCKLCNGN